MNVKRGFKAADVQFSTLENTQVFLWQTQYEVHDFAYCLNRLYGLQLSREQDYPFVTIKNVTVNSPNYLYYDVQKQLLYILVDNGITGSTVVPELENYDKVMFIYGRDSMDQCLLMYEEFNGNVILDGVGDLLGEEHKELMNRVVNEGVIDVAYYCFANYDNYETSVNYFEEVDMNSKAKKRFEVFKRELSYFLDGLERKISLDETNALHEDIYGSDKEEEWVIDREQKD